jgi:cytochrome c peroxidase
VQSEKKKSTARRSAITVVILTLVLVVGVVRTVFAANEAAEDSGAVQSAGIYGGAMGALRSVSAEIDQTELQTLQLLDTNLDSIHQIQTLGKLELFDRSLSVKKNEACSSCHMPETGYTGPSAILNLTTSAYPGSVPGRFSARKPQSYGYATLAPLLHYNVTQQDFYGGNFWDMRATGARLQSASAEQAQGPPTNPVEMGLPDNACVAYRVSEGRYASLFTKVWGSGLQAIRWPGDAEKICSTPAGKNGVGQQLNLSTEDRERANAVYDQFALSIASYEASPAVNAFSSKFDGYLAGKVSLTPQEQHGYALFNGQGKCNTCHLSGNASGASGGTVADAAPLFTDFTSSNLGLPTNVNLPYYYENKPDKYGFSANPQGLDFIDMGVGAFLSGGQVPDQSWAQYAPLFDGKVQVPTLRNVDMRPYPGFVKAYMHNGYLKSLKEVVHFYNTRDVKCPTANDPKVKTACWPQAEVTANEDTTVGNLGLSDSDEDDIVAFMKTLTDGYMSNSQVNLTVVQANIRQRRANATPNP